MGTADRYFAVIQRSGMPVALITVFIDALGIGMVYPAVPGLIVHLTAHPMNVAVAIGGWIQAIYALCRLMCSSALGNLGDRFGRRPIFIVSLAALGCDYLVMSSTEDVLWLLVARAMAGVCDAGAGTAYAYAADRTPRDERVLAFWSLNSASAAAFLIGPAIGAVAMQTAARAPFFIATFLAFTNCAIVTAFLRESLPKESRRSFGWRESNPLGAFIQVHKISGLWYLLLAFFLWRAVFDGLAAIWPYYAMIIFRWSPTELALSLAVNGVLMVFAQTVVADRLARTVGVGGATCIGFSVYAVALVGFAVVTNDFLVWMCVPLTAFATLAAGGLRSTLSNSISRRQQGQLQGVLSGIAGATMVLGPFLASETFRYASGRGRWSAGAPFMIGAFLIALVPALLIRANRTMVACSEAETLSDSV